jgi:uncharacterized protein YutE (UPF0331/DUF86 family)
VVDADVVSRRLLVLNDALGQLASRSAGISAESMRRDLLLRAAVERWIQVAIEACIDLAYHVIADAGWIPADSARGAFLRLAEHQVIDTDLAGRLGLAAGLRNILVHEYAEVDLTILAAAARDGLADLRQLGASIGALLSGA